MVDRPEELAVKILSDTHKQTKNWLQSKDYDSSAISEVNRILALSRVIQLWNSQPRDTQQSLPTKLSPTGYRNHVDPDLVQNLVADILPDLRDSASLESIQQLSPLGIVDTLGIIHSIGSHTLPPRGFSIKRLQGAFYTPSEVAYFIALRTMSPVIQECWMQCIDEDSFIDYLLRLKILDPCCGPGIFLVCALEVIQSKTRELGVESSLPINRLVDNLYGVDIDSAALEIAQLCMNLYVNGRLQIAHKTQKETRFCAGNSLINLNGTDGSYHGHFFKNSSSRFPFEWSSRLASVFKQGGFDFVLFNPPYERLKPNLAEFMRESLRAGRTKIQLKEYDSYKALIKEDLNFYRNSGEFYYSISSSMNTYQLFIERALQVCKTKGRIGFVVPSTLLGDYSSRRLRKHLLDDNYIVTIDAFHESARLFSGVTQSVCITVVEKGGISDTFKLRYGLESLDGINTSPTIEMTNYGIRNIFGDSLSIPRVDSKDWKVLQNLHSNPSISSYSWLKNHRGELDLTIDKQYIIQRKGLHPLVRGRDIGRYSLLTEGGSESVNLDLFKSSKRTSKRLKHISVPRIACQQVSNLRNQWRLKFSRIPPDTVLANSCNYLCIAPESQSWHLNYILGVMNSELLNWRFYVSSTNNHVSNREIASLPLVNPLHKQKRFIARSIAARVKSIRKHTPEVIPELESLVFQLYGINRTDAKRILKTRGLSSDNINSIIDF